MLKDRNSKNELYYWHNNDDDEQSSTSLSVSLLLKHQFGGKSSSTCSSSGLVCSCHRSFHLFCTDLLPNQSSTMINIHPAPRHHDRNARRLLLHSAKKRKSRLQDEIDQETNMSTTRSEPCQLTMVDSQSLEKKLPISLRLSTRTTSLNVPNPTSSPVNASLPFYRAFPMPAKPPPTSINRSIKPSKSFSQLQIRAQSVFDQSSGFFPNYLPRGPPPSPKTPTQDLSFIIQPSISANPFRAMSILPRTRYPISRDSAVSRSQLVKKTNYVDHAREYLSASDCSDEEGDGDHDDPIDNENDQTKDTNEKEKPTKKSKISSRVRSLSRSDTTTRERILLQHPNQYLSLAEVYYSSLDMYKNLSKRSRPQTRAAGPTNDSEETATNATETSKGNTITTKTSTSPPQVKSVFGFSKTASSMHFGHAAGRLGLQSSFGKWPQPASRRTPIERKQEVTTLRLVTLPLVTS